MKVQTEWRDTATAAELLDFMRGAIAELNEYASSGTWVEVRRVRTMFNLSHLLEVANALGVRVWQDDPTRTEEHEVITTVWRLNQLILDTFPTKAVERTRVRIDAEPLRAQLAEITVTLDRIAELLAPEVTS